MIIDYTASVFIHFHEINGAAILILISEELNLWSSNVADRNSITTWEKTQQKANELFKIPILRRCSDSFSGCNVTGLSEGNSNVTTSVSYFSRIYFSIACLPISWFYLQEKSRAVFRASMAAISVNYSISSHALVRTSFLVCIMPNFIGQDLAVTDFLPTKLETAGFSLRN